MAEEKELFLIDVDKIISEKAGDKAKYIPKFVNNWLKKILHQDDVNAFIGGDAAGKVGIDFLDACIEYLDMKMEGRGLDELPVAPIVPQLPSYPLHRSTGRPPSCLSNPS